MCFKQLIYLQSYYIFKLNYSKNSINLSKNNIYKKNKSNDKKNNSQKSNEIEIYSHRKKIDSIQTSKLKRFGSVQYGDKKKLISKQKKGLSILIKHKNKNIRDISERVYNKNPINLKEIKLFKEKIKMKNSEPFLNNFSKQIKTSKKN